MSDGYLGLSPNNTLWTSAPGPFSRLHLHDGLTGVLQAGYRPWMDNGITFTTNFDHMYIGHKVEPGEDQTAAVIQWSDNELAPAGPDVLKFIFTSNYTGASGLNSMDGREIARMHPTGWLGIGDWQAAGLQPDERLDVLTRTIRLREFSHPTWWRNDTYDRILVANPADGRVYWRDANTLGGDDCDWEVTPTADVVTAYDPTPQAGCPGELNQVGIGTAVPDAKLHVVKDFVTGPLEERGIYSELRTDNVWNRAVQAESNGVHDNVNIGVNGMAVNAARNWGVHGEAVSLSASQSGIGVFGQAQGNGLANNVIGMRATGSNAEYTYGAVGEAYTLSGGPYQEVTGVRGIAQANGNAVMCVGVYGMASGASGGNDWAGRFDGMVYGSGGVLLPSDEGLKGDVAAIEDAVTLLTSLDPRKYHYLVDEFPHLMLPTEESYGFLAQDLEAVLPNLVKDMAMPEVVDTNGVVLHPAMDIKTINYLGLVPILVAGFQEQQVQLTQQAARLDQLEQALALCCTNPYDGQQLQTPGDGGTEGRMLPDAGSERLLTIAPNPFTEQTTVSYTLERGGRAMLMVHGSDGKHLQILEEGTRSEGQYQYVWHTGHLAPGVYYVTLLLDGEPLVKRAVKVN